MLAMNRPCRFVLVGVHRSAAALLVAIHSTADSTAQQPRVVDTVRALGFEDVFLRRDFVPGSSITISPDGRWVAYAAGLLGSGGHAKHWLYGSTGGPAWVGASTLHITDTKTLTTATLSDTAAANWAPAWSPNGKYLAFCSTRDGVARLWLWDRSTKTLHRVAEITVLAAGRWSPPRWMPDSRHLLVKVLPVGGSLEQLINEGVHPSRPTQGNGETGSTRGGMVDSEPTVRIYTSSAAVDSIPTNRSQPLVDSPPIEADLEAKIDQGDLALIDVRTGSVRRLTQGTHPRWYMPSPNGTLVAFTESRGLQGGSSWRRTTDLYVVSLHDLDSRLLVAGLRQPFGMISWSPDSEWLAYVEAGPADEDLHVVAAAGGPPRSLSGGRHPRFNALADRVPPIAPIWDRASTGVYLVAADTLWWAGLRERAVRPVTHIVDRELLTVVASSDGTGYWSPDGRSSIYVQIRNPVTKAMGYARVDLKDGSVASQFEVPKSLGTTATGAGGRFVYTAEDAGRPPDVWTSNLTLSSQRQLTDLNPQLGKYTMGASRIVSWSSLDGQRLQGAVLLPAGYVPGRRYPLIVKLYGGDLLSNAVHAFGLYGSNDFENMQFFATRGYAVLLPDAPQGSVTPMADLLKTVLPGVNRVIDLGIADAERLGVIGHSYGGYSALALLVQTGRFRAAVSGAAPTNLFTVHGDLSPGGTALAQGWAEEGQGRMGGTPWEQRHKYIENSPYFYLDRLKTPLLIWQGTDDSGTDRYNSDQLFASLKRLGKDAVYLEYEGEGHSLGSYANRVDCMTRILAWFDMHLKPRESGKGLTDRHFEDGHVRQRR